MVQLVYHIFEKKYIRSTFDFAGTFVELLTDKIKTQNEIIQEYLSERIFIIHPSILHIMAKTHSKWSWSVDKDYCHLH